MNEEARRIVRDAVNAVSGMWLLPDMTRAKLLRLWGMEIGDGARISSGCFFGGTDVKIGSWTYLNQGVHVDNNGRVEIGDFCTIGMKCPGHQPCPDDCEPDCLYASAPAELERHLD